MAQDPNKKDIDPITGVETTGHEWDGIKELNKPAPRWWLFVWFATIIFSVGYWWIYPSWPTISGFNQGSLGWSEYTQLKEHQGEIATMREKFEIRFAPATLTDIKSDQELYQYARDGGAIAFKNNCSACHGNGAQGGVGYPNLNDDDWIWGGTLDQIYATIRYGAHNENANSHQGQMPAFGHDGLLKTDEIDAVAVYVHDLHKGDPVSQTAIYLKGKEVFAKNCTTCHGPQGDGNQEVGAPRLNDDIWLYGGTVEAIKASVFGGRQGIMPSWEERLDDSTLKKLAIYVHSLSGGK